MNGLLLVGALVGVIVVLLMLRRRRKKYVVTLGEYDLHHVIGAFDNRDDAQRFADNYKVDKWYFGDERPQIQEWDGGE